MNISPEFEDLFESSSPIDDKAHMISYRVLSVVEKAMESKRMTKKELAQKCGTSASYLTQLFKGDKQVNTAIMAKFEAALHIQFTIDSTTKL